METTQSSSLLLLLIISCILGSCNLFDSSDEIPQIINIDSVEVETNTEQGSNSHNIDYVWIFSEGNSLGTFEIPISAPFLQSENGPVPLDYNAGVKKNGFISEIVLYPFYQNITETINYESGSSYTPNLTFTYKENTQFRLVEDFETNHIFTRDADDNSSTQLEVSSDNPKDGQFSGLMKVDTSQREIEVASQFFMENVPLNGSAVYLELDYRNDVEFEVGLIGGGNNLSFKNYLIVLNPKEDWNKIYIDLTQPLIGSQLPGYTVLFKLTLPDGASEGNVYLDNIKFLHF